MKTAQEIFDTVARHLLTQKCAAKSITNRCAYRGVNNTKCAIGRLIPDDLYDRSIENCGIGYLIRSSIAREPNKLERFFMSLQDHRCLLQDLQGTHDNVAVENWKHNLNDIATQHDLNADVLKEFP